MQRPTTASADAQTSFDFDCLGNFEGYRIQVMKMLCLHFSAWCMAWLELL